MNLEEIKKQRSRCMEYKVQCERCKELEKTVKRLREAGIRNRIARFAIYSEQKKRARKAETELIQLIQVLKLRTYQRDTYRQHQRVRGRIKAICRSCKGS